MLQVCITCLQEITDLNFISLGDATSLTGSLKVRDVLSICVPELNLDLLTDPIMCAACMTSLHVAYDFRCKCLTTEERIRDYIDSLTHEVAPNEENSTGTAICASSDVNTVLPKIKMENPEWFETHQLEVWIKDEPQSSDDESMSRGEQMAGSAVAVNNQQKPLENFTYAQLTNSWNEATGNKNVRLDSQDTDSGWSSSNADSDMNSSGDSAEGQQLRKALQAPRKLFECGICRKTFDRSSLFHLHKKVHEDKPFKCSLCKYSAALRLNLIRHMREHTKEQPDTYNLCDCIDRPTMDVNGK